MLYEFHRNENAKKPGSVNATYVITGIQKPTDPAPVNGTQTNGDEEDDQGMQSSPYLPSSMPNQDAVGGSMVTASIILVREEDLKGMCPFSGLDLGWRC